MNIYDLNDLNPFAIKRKGVQCSNHKEAQRLHLFTPVYDQYSDRHSSMTAYRHGLLFGVYHKALFDDTVQLPQMDRSVAFHDKLFFPSDRKETR